MKKHIAHTLTVEICENVGNYPSFHFKALSKKNITETHYYISCWIFIVRLGALLKNVCR